MDAALLALTSVFTVNSMIMLVTGVILGLLLGVIPGVGGMLGLVVLVPLTLDLDAYSALALLLGLAAVTTTSDTIPAVMIGVPGTGGAITTVVDGHPMAKNGEAPRALGAAYMSSMIGGVFGAVLLSLSIPVMQPLLLSLKTPDFLAISLLGLVFVSSVSGKNWIKGVIAALLGVLVSMIGLDPTTGEERFVMGQSYLWDGAPLAAVFLGVFALPEITALSRRSQISERPQVLSKGSTIASGFRDVLREWWLVVRCSALGTFLGAVPGVGVTVIDWIAYGIAKRDRRGGPDFGSGNVRGVIAPESANNAKEGGYLIPTIAFGLPGSASMTILLAAFAIHGLSPGPEMLDQNLPVTISMVYYLVLANILGGLICLALTRQLSKIAFVPTFTIIPAALVLITIGAFQVTLSANDIFVLLIFACLGLMMKSAGYARPAFALGFVLGGPIERYFSLSQQIYGAEAFTRPSIILVMLFGGFLIYRAKKTINKTSWDDVWDTTKTQEIASALILAMIGAVALYASFELTSPARWLAYFVSALVLILSLLIAFSSWRREFEPSMAGKLPTLLLPGVRIFGFVIAVSIGLFVIGHLITTFFAVLLYLRMASGRITRGYTAYAFVFTAAIWVIFDRLISLPWPKSMLTSFLHI